MKKTKRIISFANSKGGVGKTTTTIQFALMLAEEKQRVLCINLDSRGDLNKLLGVDSDDVMGLSDLIIKNLDPKEVTYETKFEGISCIPAHMGMAAGENYAKKFVIERGIGLMSLMPAMLQPATEEFDYILFDCKPDIDFYTLSAINVSDDIVIPVSTDQLGQMGLATLQDSIEITKGDKGETRSIYILPTRYNPQQLEARQALRDLKAYGKEHAIELLPEVRESVLYKRAIAQGKIISKVKGARFHHIYAYEKLLQKVYQK